MSQTMQIKRSTGTAVPSSLASGELAYSFKSDTKKLYIGDGSNIITVGGQAFTDKLDGIEANADVTDATNVEAAGALMDSEVTNLAQVKAFSSSDYATAAQGTLATNALPKSGGTMTGNISFGDGNKLLLGDSNDLEVFHSSTSGKSFIIDNGPADLEVQTNGTGIKFRGGATGGGSSNITLADFHSDSTASSGDQYYVELMHDGTQKFRTSASGVDITGRARATTGFLGAAGATVDEFSTDGTLAGNSDVAVPTEKAVKTYVDGRFGNLSISGSTIATSGYLITLGAASNENTQVVGSLTVAGNLNVTGDLNSTTTNNLEVIDKLITVGIGQSGGLAASGSGLKIDGDDARFLFNYDSSSSSSQFEIDEGDGNFHPVIHTGNSATQTYTINGGSF